MFPFSFGFLTCSLGLSYTINEVMSSYIFPLLIILYCLSAILFILWIAASLNFIIIDSSGFMSAVFSKTGLTMANRMIERFCDISGLSAFGVSVSSYFAYYSLNANKLRKKKMIGER